MHERASCIAIGSVLLRSGALLFLVGLAPPVALAQSATPAEVAAALKVLDRWRGRWDVTITTTQPAVSTTTSVTTNVWVLDNRFLQGDSGAKSDGTRDLSMMTFDAVARVYPLWIFSSSGIVYYLANGKWDEASRSMQWDSPVSLTSSYRYRCQFADADHYRCHSLLRDWKGKALLELEAAGTRLR